MESEILRDQPPGATQVAMVDPEIVRQIRALHALSWPIRRIARELGVGRGAVRRYLRGGEAAEVQTRPTRRALTDVQRAEVVRLFDTTAEGNAVVVAQLLAERGVDVNLRCVQRVVERHRRERRAAELATVRFETAAGHQMQIDFGEKRVSVAGVFVRVMVFVAVLSYSRRVFVRAFRSQRHDDWREGLVGAFRHFRGIPQTLLIDNPRALVVGRSVENGAVRLHPAFEAFCRDWGVVARACQPYRARTKGKTERGVGYAKSNALAARDFESWGELDAHLERWMLLADERVHGTTHEKPRERFEREEATALQPLPSRPMPVRQRRLARRVATDCFVDVDTVRYSVPHRLVRRSVEVLVGDDEVVVFDGRDVVARHRRCDEPHRRVVDPLHFEGLCRVTTDERIVDTTLQSYGRSLADYAAALGGES
jgi:transposase